MNAQIIEKPWLKSYPSYVDWGQNFEAFPIHEVLDISTRKYPESLHIDFLGKQTSYRHTHGIVEKAAKGFQELGVKPGVRVGIFLPNCRKLRSANFRKKSWLHKSWKIWP